MKVICFYLFIFFLSLKVNGQNKIFYVKDKGSKKIVSNVNIDLLNGNFTSSDNTGKIIIKNSIKKILLSHVGFENLLLETKDIRDTVFMLNKTINLNEVLISSKKQKKKLIFPKRGIGNISTKNIGTNTPLHVNEMRAVFIPNENKTQEKWISKIIIKPTNYNIMYPDSVSKLVVQKEAKYAPFKVNLYTSDTIIGIPKNPIFEKEFEVKLEKGSEYVNINLENEKIIFPDDGIFIVISSFSKDYYKSNGYNNAPSFYSIITGKKSKFKQYIKFLWREEDSFWEKDNWFWDNYSIFYFGLEILTDK
jgi:hypothetical protein